MTVIKEDHIGNFSITYENLSEHQCLCLRFHGKYGVKCSEIVVRESVSLMKDYSYKHCIVDLRDSVYDMELVDIYHRAALWEEAGVPKDNKVAYVTQKDRDESNMVFLDNVLSNRGWTVRRFLSMQDAFNWLDSLDQNDPGFAGAG